MLKGISLGLVLCATAALAKPPRLVIFVSVDSLGAESFLRNKPRYKAGFAKVLNEGAFFPVMKYDVAECVTAVGHTTLVTGANPWRHGIVSNRVLNRTTGKLEAVFADPGHPVLEAPIGADDVSPQNLLAETLSDHLRQTTWMRGKSVAISGKGRAAIAMAGRLGDAWWFHEQVGRFVTGTWYRKETPAWVKAFNDKKLPDAYHAKMWTLLADAKEYFGEDDRPFESEWYGLGKIFPHPLNGGLPSPGQASYSALASSPMMNDVMLEFAKAAIDGEQLGKDDVPDLLSISFSAVDRSYHLYGPSSWETQDQMARFDKTLADLIAVGEKAAGGKQNFLLVVSGDHGGAALPEEWASVGLDGVRVPPANIQKAVNDELQSRFGIANAVVAMEETDIYLDLKAIADKKLDASLVRRAAAQVVMKQADVAVAVARDDLEAGDGNGLVKAIRTGFHPDRSGDVLMVLRPFHVLESEPKGTSHGTPYSYDSQVPLLMYGRGVKPGQYTGSAHVVDIAPTVATLMEMSEPSSSEGRVLSEAVQLVR